MNAPSARLLILAKDNVACIKIVGRATFTSSIDFRTVVIELRKKGFTHFVLELSECVLMDSTFLGVLAGLGLQLKGTDDKSRGVELLNANSRITELLETLGVLHLFMLSQGSLPSCAATEALPAPAASRADLTQTCLKAHETLMAINPENVARFKEVTQFLADDLRKLQGGS